jgi:hypothetical protein
LAVCRPSYRFGSVASTLWGNRVIYTPGFAGNNARDMTFPAGCESEHSKAGIHFIVNP